MTSSDDDHHVLNSIKSFLKHLEEANLNKRDKVGATRIDLHVIWMTTLFSIFIFLLRRKRQVTAKSISVSSGEIGGYQLKKGITIHLSVV